MSPTYVEGIPWPEGDPHALRAIAKHAGRIAFELTLHHVFFDFDSDWTGVAMEAYALQVAEHDHAIHAGANAMLAAGDALTVLASAVETGQAAVRSAAADVGKARDIATAVADRAHELRESADQQNAITTILTAGTRPAGAPPGPPSPEELQARQAESDALNARFAALDLEAERRKPGQAAYDDVVRADQVCAAKLEALHLVPAPNGSSSGVPALAVLGSALLGQGADSSCTLLTLLTKPTPLPDTVKKPKKSNFWLVTALGAGAAVLTVANLFQGGLDPATDGLEAADVALLTAELEADAVLTAEAAEAVELAEVRDLAHKLHYLAELAETGHHADEEEYRQAEEKAKKLEERLAEAGAPVSAGLQSDIDAAELEHRGDLPGPLRSADGKANASQQGARYVDANGNHWRHEVVASALDGFDATQYLDKLQASDLANNQGVMLNYEGLTSDQLKALLQQIDHRGVRSQFRFIPPL